VAAARGHEQQAHNLESLAAFGRFIFSLLPTGVSKLPSRGTPNPQEPQRVNVQHERSRTTSTRRLEIKTVSFTQRQLEQLHSAGDLVEQLNPNAVAEAFTLLG